MSEIITAKGICKHYPGFELGPLDFVVPRGCITGLIGENGAGKTTLLKLLLNITVKEAGSVIVLNQDMKNSEKAIKQEIGVVLDDAFCSDTLTAKQVGVIMRNFYPQWDAPLYARYLQQFSLPENKPLKELSKGMKKKAEIASALSHHPKLLILDEPTSGLDPVVRSEILDIFRDFVQDDEHGILLSSHITSDLEHIADYIAFLHQGKLVFSCNRDELSERYGVVKGKEETLHLLRPEQIVSYRRYPYATEILIKEKETIKKDYPELVVDQASIEDIMLFSIKGEKL